MKTERPEPILPARNLDETRAFYEKLGFVETDRKGVHVYFPKAVGSAERGVN